jgi:phage shock protein C
LQVNRRLYRCREDRVLAGVASGVAEFFGLDPTLVRILWFLSILVGGFGILAYIGLAFIVPLEPASPVASAGPHDTTATHTLAASGLEGHRHQAGRRSGRVSLYLGITLIVIGSFALVRIALPGWASWSQLAPVLLILFGGFLIYGATRPAPDSPAPAVAASTAVGGGTAETAER